MTGGLPSPQVTSSPTERSGAATSAGASCQHLSGPAVTILYIRILQGELSFAKTTTHCCQQQHQWSLSLPHMQQLEDNHGNTRRLPQNQYNPNPKTGAGTLLCRILQHHTPANRVAATLSLSRPARPAIQGAAWPTTKAA